MSGRYEFLLDGNWRYLQDTRNVGKTKGFFHVGFDDSEWSKMPIPSNWHLQGLKDYCGVVWFRHCFNAPKELEGKNVKLVFDGVDYFAEVWLNGSFLGAHEGYFSPFSFNITEKIRFDGENVLVVKVDSPFEETGKIWPNFKKLIKGVYNHHDCRPGGASLQNGQDGNTGGIWNHVRLIGTGAFCINNVAVTPILLPNGSANLIIDIDVTNFHPKLDMAHIKIEVKGASFESRRAYRASAKRLLYPGKNVETLAIKVDKPKLWWPWDHGRQDLYNLFAQIGRKNEVSDQVQVRFGIRDIKVRDWNFYVNGRRIFLGGTNYIATQWLSEMDKEKYLKDAKLLKDANINAIRVHAHLERTELLEVCDEEGILVWQDFPLIWGYDTSSEFTANAVKQIREMIRLYYNHPSIIVWCCHNEPPKHNLDELDPILYQTASGTDSTRYIDIASTNEYHPYYGWYLDDYQKYSSLPGKPFINEFGAQALPCLATLKSMFKTDELWPPKWDVWAYHNFQFEQTFKIAKISMGKTIAQFIENSQKYQAELVRFAVECYRRAKYNPMTGIFQFMFVDCWPAITWAIVDYYRRPKRAYYALKNAFSPVLVSLQLNRQIFTPNSMVEGNLWIVNDLYRDYKKATLEVQIVDESGRIHHKEKYAVDIEIDRADFIRKFSWIIPQRAFQENYQIKLKLSDSSGNRLSENEYEISIKK